jgi:hypothetical protein
MIYELQGGMDSTYSNYFEVLHYSSNLPKKSLLRSIVTGTFTTIIYHLFQSAVQSDW